MRASAAQINEDAASGPPEGLPASGLMVLIDPDGGRSMAITFFGSEEDRAKGHEVLEGMSPPGEGMGSRTGRRDVRGRGRHQDVAGSSRP